MAEEEGGKKVKEEKNEAKDKRKPQPEKKTEPAKKPENGEGGSNLKFYILIAFGIIVIAIGAVLMLTPGGEGGSGDAQVIASALGATGEAMEVAEQANGFSIQRDKGEIIFENNSRIVRFPIEGSENFTTFDVMLNEELELRYVGLNGVVMELDRFIMLQQGPNTFQACAKIFNENAAIPDFVARWYNGTATQRHILTVPKTLNCSGTEYPYSFEIGDGYVTTTINGYYFRNGFNKGIVTETLKIPEEDLSQGIFLYVDRIAPGKLRYSYDLVEQSALTFDEYEPLLIKAYNIESVPRLVWNCKFALARTLATAELAGDVPQGFEENVLKMLTCIYGNGEPKELCEPLGVSINETGGIEAQLPTEYLFSMYETGQDSCKPEGGVFLQAFHKPGSQACEDQRQVLDRVKAYFGDVLDLEYQCVDESEICTKLVGARGL